MDIGSMTRIDVKKLDQFESPGHRATSAWPGHRQGARRKCAPHLRRRLGAAIRQVVAGNVPRHASWALPPPARRPAVRALSPRSRADVAPSAACEISGAAPPRQRRSHAVAQSAAGGFSSLAGRGNRERAVLTEPSKASARSPTAPGADPRRPEKRSAKSWASAWTVSARTAGLP